MMAIENTIAGSLLQNHELIRESGLQVIGEYKLRISHSLVALPGTNIDDVREVNSHPIALMQCTEFLDTLPNAKVVEKEDTAMSARWISENQLKGHAAICGKLAAQIYNMEDYLRYKQALDAIRPLTKDLKILGEYAEGKQSV